uniref:Sec16_C domain-containing protein n=1 Tax=Rhabditophanes sp. KR3021 TaxID=114890 RepID=A0AC35U2F5_9BILA
MSQTIDAFDFKKIEINNKSTENNYEWSDLLNQSPNNHIRRSNCAALRKLPQPTNTRKKVENHKVIKHAYRDSPLDDSKSIADERTLQELNVSIDVILNQEPANEYSNIPIVEPSLVSINSKILILNGDCQRPKTASKLSEGIHESGDGSENQLCDTVNRQVRHNQETILDAKQKNAQEYCLKDVEIETKHNIQVEETFQEDSNLYTDKPIYDKVNVMQVPYPGEIVESKKVVVSDYDGEKIVVGDIRNGNARTTVSDEGNNMLLFKRMSSSPFISDPESGDNSTEFCDIKQSITFNLNEISPIKLDKSHPIDVINMESPAEEFPISAELTNQKADPVKLYRNNTDSAETSVKSVLDHRKTLRDKAKKLAKPNPDNDSVFLLRMESSSRMKKSASNPLIRGGHSKKLVLTTPAIMGRIKEDSKKGRDRDHISDSEDDLVERKRRDRFTRPASSSISGRAPSRGGSSEAGDQSNYRQMPANRSNYGPPPSQMRPMGYTQPGPPIDIRMGSFPYQPRGYYQQQYDTCMGSGRYSAQIHGRYTPNESVSYQNYMMPPNYYPNNYPNYGPPPPQQFQYRPRSSFEPSTRKTADYGDVRSQRRVKDPSQDYSLCESNPSDVPYPPPKRGSTFPPQLNDGSEEVGEEEAYEDEVEGGESETELAQYNDHTNQMYIADNFVLNSILSYNLGIIGMDVNLAYEIIRESRPPAEFERLPPQAQAIYLHYYSVFRNFLDIGDFMGTFNKKYSIYEASGRSEKDILTLICKSTEEQFRKQVEEDNKRKLEEAQRLLLATVASPDSENRESGEDDVDSLLSYNVEPYFFTGPHRFQNFTSAGITLYYDPKECDKKIQLAFNKDWYLDSEERKILEYVKAQPGPLNVATVAFHEVELFVKEQIERIRKSQLYKQDPNSRDPNDCILVWKLLQLLVKQDGVVKPQQFAELLLEDGLTSLHVDRNEDDDLEIEGLRSPRELSRQEFAEFTLLLANGHTKKAIKYAVDKNAIQLALSICLKFMPDDTHQIKEILKKSLAQSLPSRHPVEGMVNILENGVVPSLNDSDENCFDWRIYASYVFSNLGKTTTIASIYNMGVEFSKNDYHAAADFCFLATHCFHPSYNPFVAPPIQANEDASYRKHITLIHASVPDDPPTNATTRFGWSVIDFKATEIYEYALQLATKGQSPQNVLTLSKDFQICRMQYSLMISQFGGLAKPAFDYCFSIASNVWTQTQIYDIQNLEKLCELADSLKFWGCADDNSSAWIPTLEKACQERRGIFLQQPPPHQLSPGQTFSEPTSKETSTYPQTESIQHDNHLTQQDSLPKEETPTCVEPTPEKQQSNVATDSTSYSPPTPTPPVEHSNVYVGPVVHQPPPNLPTQEKAPCEAIAQQNVYESNGMDGDAIPTFSPTISPRKKSRTFSMSSDKSKKEASPDVPTFEYSKPTHQPEVVQYQRAGGECVNQQAKFVPEDHTQPKPPPQPTNTFPQQQPHNVVGQHGVSADKAKKGQEKGSSGYLNVLKNKLVKYIPGGNEMKLPDDSNNKIYFDKDLNKWVGTEVEEEAPVAAPPTMMNGSVTGQPNGPDPSNTNSNSSGYQSRRQPGRSRYCNPLSGQAASTIASPPEMNGMVPGASSMADMSFNKSGFGFIPTMPVDDSEPVDPFSTHQPTEPAH